MSDDKQRRKLATELLELEIDVAPALLKIDDLKEKLRAIAIADNAGFTEEIAGKGTVEVKAAAEPRFKGIVPTLKVEAFLCLSKARQATLEKEGIVELVREFTKASKPSVTVRL